VTMMIDGDSHVGEARDLYSARMSKKKWGDLIPTLKRDPDSGREYWYVGDKQVSLGTHSAMMEGDDPDVPVHWPYPYPNVPMSMDDVHPASNDIGRRVKMMDRFGIKMATLYPNLNFVDVSIHAAVDDPEFQLECIRVYNDWLLDWIAPHKDRFIPLACIPYWDIPAAIAEIERCADLGFKGLVSTGTPHRPPHNCSFLADRIWDPMWRAAEVAGLSIAFHVGGGDVSSFLSADRLDVEGSNILSARAGTTSFLDNSIAITDLLFSGVLPRFPDLKFVAVEAGLGWVPFVMEAADTSFWKAKVRSAHPEFVDLPSDYFRRQVYTTVWFEKISPFYIERFGSDHILFETDFPHSVCLDEAQLRRAVDTNFVDVTQETKDRILWKNAVDLYGLDLSIV
jgi:predicted TIM-barrel fold metal-dependent hydrolase